MRPAIALLVFLAGCSHATFDTGSGHGSIGLDVHGRAAGALLIGGLLVAAAADEPGEPPAEMAPGRRITEQDCTRPVDFTAGNLRCR